MLFHTNLLQVFFQSNYRLTLSQNTCNPDGKKPRIIYPSDIGFHPRSNSPTFKRLRYACEILNDFIPTQDLFNQESSYKSASENKDFIKLIEKGNPKALKVGNESYKIYSSFSYLYSVDSIVLSCQLSSTGNPITDRIPRIFMSNPSLRVCTISDITSLRHQKLCNKSQQEELDPIMAVQLANNSKYNKDNIRFAHKTLHRARKSRPISSKFTPKCDSHIIPGRTVTFTENVKVNSRSMRGERRVLVV